MIFIFVLIFVLAFAIGTWFGAPYLPTQKKQIFTAIELLELKSGQTVIDLGSGDGSFLLLAAKKGIHGIGYEINPFLVFVSRLRTWRYRKVVKIHLANFWQVQLPECDGVYTFLIKRYMKKLDNKLTSELKKPTRVASYVFKIPNKKFTKTRNGIQLYNYGNKN